jgi:single-strand DNA-binding protein
MAGETPITVVGNLTADPELRFTPSGAAVANFTVASTPRTFDKQTNEWKDGEALFLNCSVWRQAAENAAESLVRGMRVIVQGNLKARSYETREGEKRTVFEIDVQEVGPSLKYATAKVQKTSRSGGGGGGFSGGNDPWASSGPSQQGAQPAPQGGGDWSGQQGSQPSGQPGGQPGGQQGGQQAGQPGGSQGDPWAASTSGSSDDPPF